MKYLVTLLMILSTEVFADNWQLLADAGKNRLIVDVESVTVDLYDGDKLRVYSSFEMLNPTLGNRSFVAIIDVQECIKNGAGSIVYVLDKETLTTNFWSKQGSKLTDFSGSFLCESAINFISEKNKPNYNFNYM